MQYVVVAFYQFVALPDFREMREPLLQFCREREIKGTILLAQEGINSTVAGSRQAIDELLAHLRSDERLASLQAKESFVEFAPFARMKVELRSEIVGLKVPGIDPNKKVGTYVAPQDWNDLICDPDVILIDTRNDFEVEIGTFKGAVNPHTASFSDFPQYVEENLDPQKQPKVAMFCTGGIRCEKATSYLLENGFEQVYHLEGGILNYLEKVPQDQSTWQGECFVFDNRVSVDHDLKPGHYVLCHGCGHPVSEAERESPFYEEGVSCPRCAANLSDEKKQAARERQRQCELAAKRQKAHIGDAK